MEEKFTDREGAYATALYAQMEKSGIPSHMRNALAEWILYHRPCGGFLQNLLANNLFETYAKADLENQRSIKEYIDFLYNHAPSTCWGSPRKVADWCDEKYRNLLEPYNVREALKDSQ